MFIWGSGHKTLTVPVDTTHHCPSCNTTTAHHLRIDYDYSHIFWLFKGLKNKKISIQCEGCNLYHETDKATEKMLMASVGSNPIPLMDKYGGHILIAIIVAWFLFALNFPCSVNPNSHVCAESKAQELGGR
jgi:hypothetical protein